MMEYLEVTDVFMMKGANLKLEWFGVVCDGTSLDGAAIEGLDVERMLERLQAELEFFGDCSVDEVCCCAGVNQCCKSRNTF